MFYVFADIKSPIPDALGFQVIETVGHVRAALDKMIAEMVIINGRGVSGVSFPFGGMGEDGMPEPFPTARHDRVKKKLTPEQWQLVLSQKPYPGGNDALWSVNSVANASKHGAGLVEVSADFSFDIGAMSITPYLSPLSYNREFPGEIRLLRVPANAVGKHLVAHVISMKGHIRFDKAVRIVFADVAPVTQKDVLVVVNQQIRLATQIIDLFDALP